jgi:Flp pilus assembly protein TadB
MAGSSFDTLRALAIASQAVGFILIITLETVLGDAARPWQGVTLAAMVVVALGIAVVRLYRRNRRRKALARRLADEEGAD